MQEDQKKPPTRIARFLLPNIDPKSGILPTDKWIVENALAIFKDNRTVKQEALRVLGYSALTLAGVAGTVAGLVATFPLSTMTVAVFCAGFGLAMLLGQKTRDAIASLKTSALPEVRNEMSLRYVRMKTDEIGLVWKQKLSQKSKDPEKTVTAAPETTASSSPRPSLAKGIGKWAFKQALSRKKPAASSPEKQAQAPKPD